MNIRRTIIRYAVIYGSIDFVIYVLMGPNSKLNFTAYLIIFLVMLSGSLYLKNKVGNGIGYKIAYIAFFAGVYTGFLSYLYGSAIQLTFVELFAALFVLQTFGYLVSARAVR